MTRILTCGSTTVHLTREAGQGDSPYIPHSRPEPGEFVFLDWGRGMFEKTHSDQTTSADVLGEESEIISSSSKRPQGSLYTPVEVRGVEVRGANEDMFSFVPMIHPSI